MSVKDLLYTALMPKSGGTPSTGGLGATSVGIVNGGTISITPSSVIVGSTLGTVTVSVTEGQAS